MLGLAREAHERSLEGINKLEARLPFRFAILQRLLDKQIARIVARHGLSVTAYRTLTTIEAFGELSGADLVRLVAVDKGLVSRSCRQLIKDGYIEARPDSRNSRRKLHTLTRTGAAKMAAVMPEADARNAAISALFDANEHAELVAAIERITVHLAQSLDEDAFKTAS